MWGSSLSSNTYLPFADFPSSSFHCVDWKFFSIVKTKQNKTLQDFSETQLSAKNISFLSLHSGRRREAQRTSKPRESGVSISLVPNHSLSLASLRSFEKCTTQLYCLQRDFSWLAACIQVTSTPGAYSLLPNSCHHLSRFQHSQRKHLKQPLASWPPVSLAFTTSAPLRKDSSGLTLHLITTSDCPTSEISNLDITLSSLLPPSPFPHSH